MEGPSGYWDNLTDSMAGPRRDSPGGSELYREKERAEIMAKSPKTAHSVFPISVDRFLFD